MKKIIFFLPSSVGGAEKVSINYSRLLDEDNFQKIFVLIGKDCSDIKKLLPNYAKTYEIKINNINRWGIFRILKILWKENPDFTFSSMFWVNVRVLLAAKILRIKSIVRNNITIDRLQWWMKISVKYSYRYAHKIIVQQEEMYNEIICFMPFIKNKTIVIHNPFIKEDIDTKKNLSNPFVNKDEIKVLWVGRISREKGQDVLIKALKQTTEVLDNIHLYLLGKYQEDNYYKELKVLIDKLNLKNRVHFCGFDSNPYRWMNNCDCFVMPSRLEGLPNALVEAMYLKKPVVATKCIPIVSRMVQNGYNGYLVESEDYQSMGNAIIRALTLKNFKMTYKPSDKETIKNIFK